MKANSRVVLYRRVSALMGRGGEDFHSPEMQTNAMRKHLAGLGLREVAQCEDIDVSGRTFNREGLDQVRRLVEDKQVDAVAVYDLSRLGRNTAEALGFIRWLTEHRVALISTVEKIDDTPEGKLTLTLWLGMAELQSNQIGRRWSEVIRHRAHQGKQHGKPLIGYRSSPSGWVADPVVGPAVTDAFRQYANGEPLCDITARLGKARGVPTYRQVVKRTLANPIYLGKATLWGGTTSRNHTWENQPAHVIDGTHPPLVDQETFDRCVARQVRDSKAPARTLKPSHALVRSVFCADCGGAAIATANGARVRKYRCAKQDNTRGCQGCGSPQIVHVEQKVLAEIAEYTRLLRSPVAAKRHKLVRQREPVEDVEAIAAELEKIRGDMTRLVDRWVSGKIPDHAYEELLGRYRGREDELSRRKAAAGVPTPLVDVGRLASVGERLVELWDEMQPWERNEAVRTLGARVEIRRSLRPREPVEDRVEVTFPV